VGPRNRVLDEGTRWRHLPNTINRVVRRAAATIAAPNCLLLLLIIVKKLNSLKHLVRTTVAELNN